MCMLYRFMRFSIPPPKHYYFSESMEKEEIITTELIEIGLVEESEVHERYSNDITAGW